jgi:hypothetical protein
MKKRKLHNLLTQLSVDIIEHAAFPYSIQMKLDSGKILNDSEINILNERALGILHRKNLVYKKIKKALK